MPELSQTLRRMPAFVAEDGSQTPWFAPDGSLVTFGTPGWRQAMINAGYGWNFNAGSGSTPITFGAAYDATAPDLYIYVPSGTVILPFEIGVIYEAVGTESIMEPIAAASPVGDPSATGTAATKISTGSYVRPLRIGYSGASVCTCTAAVDASGIDTPIGTGYTEFWKHQRPLTDTVATTENDRHELVFRWNADDGGGSPPIMGSPAGSCLAVYAPSQAGTGYVYCKYLEFSGEDAQKLFGAYG